jgi:hypothetical protein
VRFALLWFVACVLFGCKGPIDGAVAGDDLLGGDATVEKAWLDCSNDNDCTYVDLDCCGCTAGGSSLAINADHVADFEEANPLDCDTGESCVMVYRCGGDPVCRGGNCQAP